MFDTCVDLGGILITKHLIKIQCVLFGLPIPRILKMNKKIAVIWNLGGKATKVWISQEVI
jgi:hypothetical protein